MRSEEIAAFVSGSISSEKREAITAHLARCVKCRKVVAGVVASQKALPDRSSRKR